MKKKFHSALLKTRSTAPRILNPVQNIIRIETDFKMQCGKYKYEFGDSKLLLRADGDTSKRIHEIYNSRNTNRENCHNQIFKYNWDFSAPKSAAKHQLHCRSQNAISEVRFFFLRRQISVSFLRFI